MDFSAIQQPHEDGGYHVRKRRSSKRSLALTDKFSCMNVSVPGQKNQLLVWQNIAHSFLHAADLMPLGEFSSVTGAVRLLEQKKGPSLKDVTQKTGVV